MRSTHLPLILTALLLSAGCAGQGTAPVVAPSPTIAAAPIQPAPARPTPSIAVGGRPTSAPAIQASPAGSTSQASTEPSIYLWPTYLPPNMRLSPTESRVASEGETGEAGLGFYIITLNDGERKLSIGGGDISDVLPLDGDRRPVIAGGRSGMLITSDDRREIVFDMARGKLFLYSAGLSEEELLKVAASLQPIDVKLLREMAGTP